MYSECHTQFYFFFFFLQMYHHNQFSCDFNFLALISKRRLGGLRALLYSTLLLGTCLTISFACSLCLSVWFRLMIPFTTNVNYLVQSSDFSFLFFARRNDPFQRCDGHRITPIIHVLGCWFTTWWHLNILTWPSPPSSVSMSSPWPWNFTWCRL